MLMLLKGECGAGEKLWYIFLFLFNGFWHDPNNLYLIVFQIPAELLEDSEDHNDESTDDSELEDSEDDDLDDIQPFRPELGIYLPGPWEEDEKLARNRFNFDLILLHKLLEFDGTVDVVLNDVSDLSHWELYLLNSGLNIKSFISENLFFTFWYRLTTITSSLSFRG